MADPRQPFLPFGRGGISDPPSRFIELARENNPDRDDLRAAAALWIVEHPRIFAEIEARALHLAGEGKAFGMKRVIEEVRWDWQGRADEQEEFLINNNHTAYLARALVEKHPSMMRLLRFRQTRY